MSLKGLATVCFLLSATWAAGVAAQGIESETAKLEQLHQRLSNLQQNQQQIEQQVSQLQSSLKDAQSRPSPENAQLDAAQKALEQARADYQTDPSEVNSSRVQNAEFKLALIERKFSKTSSEASELSARIADLNNELEKNRSAIANTEQSIERQEAAINRLRSQRLAEERSMRQRQQEALQRSQAEAEAAQREIARLRAMLAQREAEAQQQVEQKRAVVASTPVQPRQAEAKPEAKSTAGNSLILSRQDQVVAALTAIQDKLENNDPRHPPVNRILHVKHAGATDSFKLKALGAEQYRAEVKVAASGERELVVGFNRWNTEIPAAGEYVFLYDGSNPKKPELHYYNIQLER